MMRGPRAGAPRVGVFHPGTQHSWQTALAFQEAGRLGWYATSIFYDPARWPYRLERLLPRPLAGKAHRRFTRRHTPALRPALIRQFGLWEWLESGASYLRYDGLAQWANYCGNRDFARHVIALAQREPVDILWGFDTSSREVFQWAKRAGIFCVLDRTTAHGATVNEVMRAEYERHPEFFGEPFRPKPQAKIDEEDEEIGYADLVVVGSRYCADTLVAHGCPPEKIRVLSYGYDEANFAEASAPSRREVAGPIEFLYAGNVSARKGVAYALRAFEQIDPSAASLTLVGRLALPPATFARFAPRVRHVPSVPRTEVVRHFLAADCLVVPGICEGSSVVLREAYGAGIGAVQTAASGDGVVDGRNGRIVAAGSVEAIVGAVEALVRDPDLLSRWQDAARSMRQDQSWAAYRARARQLVDAAA